MHSRREAEGFSQWDAPVKHGGHDDNISGWDTSPQSGSRYEKAACGAAQGVGENVSGWDASPAPGSRYEKAAGGGAHLR